MEKDKKQSPGEDVSQLNSDRACSRREPEEPEDRASLQSKEGDKKASNMGKESDQDTIKKVLHIQIRTEGDEYKSFREKAVEDCNEYYPDCDKKSYRVTPTIVNHKIIAKKIENTKPYEEYSTLKGKNKENTKGKDAELLVRDAFEDIHTTYDEKQKVTILFNYGYKYDLNEGKTELSPKTEILHKAGEHDILLIYRHHGVVFIQVNAVEEGGRGETKKQRDNYNKTIRTRVKKGLSQLDRDVEMFKHTMKDLHLNIPITKVLVLPKISKKYISTLTTSMKLLQDTLGENALDICLFHDEININTNYENEGKELLLEWWKRNISTKRGFRDADEYNQVIGRYVSLVSTVKIITRGDTIDEKGYQNTRIILTPEQVESLQNERKMYIHGSFGTGKTILLILKARQIVQECESVLMIFGRLTKQLLHLIARVKADMTKEQKTLVHYITDYRKLNSLDSTEQYNIFVVECYMLAISYIVTYCGKNNKLCWLAGRCVPDVKKFSVYLAYLGITVT